MTTVFTVEDDGDTLWWSVQQLANSTELQLVFIEQCVELGLAEVSGARSEWRFNSAARMRLQRAWRLHRDLELHLEALPLVLDLLEEVEALRHESMQLRSRLQHWEPGHD